MSSQAEQLQQTMSFFRLNGSGQGGGFAVRKSSASAKKVAMAKSVAKVKPSAKLALTAASDLDESQFTKF
jgi:methyl-accepting chemotaxis protein